MKRIILLVISIIMLTTSTCLADDTISSRYLPILQDWDASTAEELRLNIIEHWKSIDTTPDNASAWSPRIWPLAIRFGGTTKELIDDKKNWQLAIVSSKDVNLQELVDNGIIDALEGRSAANVTALYTWLLPDTFSYLKDPNKLMNVFVYDYNSQTDDATLLICQPVPQRENPPMARLFAEEIMWKRSADIARAVQGIRVIPDRAKWTEEDFFAYCDEWDVGILRVKEDQLPSILDQTGLLYNFSQIDYFASRPSVDMPRHLKDIPNGIFNANNQMIGIPCIILHVSDPDAVGMLIVNAKSSAIERSLLFAEHYIRSVDQSLSE